MERIQLRFNEKQYNAKKTELQNIVHQRNDALDIIKRITNGEITTLNFDKVCAYLNNKTGFVNSEMSANAMGVKEEYNIIRDVANAKHKDEDSILLVKGKYSFNQRELKETYTEYLKDDHVQYYKQLTEVCKLLADIPKPLRRTIYLMADEPGISREQFNAIMQMVERG